jgi:MscS family membrane protein
MDRFFSKHLLLFAMTIGILFSFVSYSNAQTDTAPPVTLVSPQNTMWVHLYYLQPDSYQPELAAKTISPSVSDTLRAQRLAKQIKQVFDAKGLFVDLESIPTNPEQYDSTRSAYIYTPFPRELPAVYLKRIDNKWYYSAETIGQIGNIHDQLFLFGSEKLVDLFPEWGQNRFLGLQIWKYIGLAVLLLILAIFHFILSRVLQPFVRKVSQSKLQPTLISPKLISRISAILSYLLLFQLAKVLLPSLLLPITWSSFLVKGIRIATALLFMMLLLRIVDVIMMYSTRFTMKTSSRLDEQLMPIVKRILQVVIVTGAIFQILRLLEFNVTALIAGVSIGGLALALAAQDTVKNLIGSAMIFFDKPFQIGDWVEGSGFSGGVVEVGFRTTKIQTLDSSIISVPNGTIANAAVTNLGARIYRLMNVKIGILYNTPPAKIEQFLEGLRQMAIRHPKVREEGYYVYLSEMADSSLNILFRVQLDVPDYVSELKIKEELYFGILRLGETLGVSFAFPSRSLYIENADAPQKMASAEEMEQFLNNFKENLHE